MKRRVEFRIPADRAGEALGDFLAQRFPYHSREGWQEEVEAGRLRVNGRRARVEAALAEGDLVEYDVAHLEEPPVREDYEVVFEDRDLLVVNKPADLPCHPGGRYFNHTLWAILRRRAGLESPAIVNRLDRETSGLVVVARNAEAAKKCRAQFAGRSVEKRYVAIVEGLFPAEMRAVGFMFDAAEGDVRKLRRFHAAGACGQPLGAAGEGGEWADTEFRLVRVHGSVSEIEARPHTGRLHQVRATLRAVGFPVVGDKLYGVDPSVFVRFCQGAMSDEDRARMRLDRQALHAEGLRFEHPRTKRPLELVAPMPSDLTALLAAMDGAGRVAAEEGRPGASAGPDVTEAVR